MQLRRESFFWLRVLLVGCLVLCGRAAAGPDEQPPNIVLIFCDDLGYGDLGCYGHPQIRTPHVDRLARAGQRWTSFYASANVCNPSRVALMSGRLPARLHGGTHKWADLPPSEITIAELLHSAGYASALLGKWHLGMEAGKHPLDQGFDYFYGTSSSNDSHLRAGVERTYAVKKNATNDIFEFPLLRGRDAIEKPVDQRQFTQRYTREAVSWIRTHHDRPFFLFLSHNMPHVPLFRSEAFAGRSSAGVYGDVIEEIDWSVGEIVKTLEELSLTEKTLVIFTSDNGPWRTYFDLGGSAGPFRDGKSTCWEGGFRVPAVFWWPGRIQSSVVRDIGANVDLFATLARLAGVAMPQDRAYDSHDLSGVLLNQDASPRDRWFYYSNVDGKLWAARLDRFKLHHASRDTIGTERIGNRGHSDVETHVPPLLFDLGNDVAEERDIAAEMPEIVQRIEQAIAEHRESL